MEELVAKLHSIQAVKFGTYTLKSGIVSPIYFDLRVIISHPDILESVAAQLWDVFGRQTDLVCGVPYTALPIATLISVRNKVPMLLRRKEAKDYGTKKLIEGEYTAGQNCLIVEDVVTSGSSVLETAQELRKNGLIVTDAVVLLDRQQGGRENLEQNGIKLHSVFSIEKFMLCLKQKGLVSEKVVEDVASFIKGNFTTTVNKNPRLALPLEDRMKRSKHSIARKIFQIMETKQSNLCVAADLPILENVIKLAEEIGPQIVVLKIHVDIFDDFTDAKIQQLKELSKKHNFLIMEDRKFADIANTAQFQYSRGIYKIYQWADLITVHPLPGPQLVNKILDIHFGLGVCGIVLILEMSSQGALTTPEYRKEAAKLVDTYRGVMGFVCQSPLDDEPIDWIQFTPGVNLTSTTDNKGQQYSSPSTAVARGADIIIVGRGLINSDNVVQTAERYRIEGWTALCKRIQSNN